MEKANNNEKKPFGSGGARGGAGGKTIKNASTQVIYKKQTKKETDKKTDVPKPKKKDTSFKGAQRIGSDPKDDRWRCNICSFMNSEESPKCSMCDSEKGEKKHQH